MCWALTLARARSSYARAVLLGVLEHTFAIPLGYEVERVR
jgi:hypothetical protein